MKKHIMLMVAVLMASGICSVGLCQEYYQKGNYRLVPSQYSSSFVAGINIDTLAEQYFPEFRLYRNRVFGYTGRRYTYILDSDKIDLNIIVGVFPSIEITEEEILNYLIQHQGAFQEGKTAGLNIGDNAWWWGYKVSEKVYFYNIAFVRKNALVALSIDLDSATKYSSELLALAETIDSALMTGASYAFLADTLSPPVIQSAIPSKSALREKESVPITIIAVDPRGKKIEYQSFGAGHKAADPENVFHVTASRSYFSEPFFGEHALGFWVINDENACSRIYQIKVNF